MEGKNPKVRIGLETHIQLNSQSKIFCGCRNPVNLSEEPEPNSLTCETCLGFPGSKPRTNRAVIEMAVRLALVLNARLARETFFSRKTYFYPDMSKNFQITQYEIPIASGGFLEVSGRKIRIKRIHMEEDPARIVHVGGFGGKYTLIDYNRSGIPLLEVVTEPDFSTPGEAREYLQRLETILEYLGIYDSASRAVIKSDANISLEGGARIEVKNITGTREVEQALKYEIVRQQNLVRRGVKVERETRLWNPEMAATQGMRGKEEEAEYGYIFEPDLTRITRDLYNAENIKKQLPELPDQKMKRFVKQYRLPEKVAESIVSELDLANLFEDVSKKVGPKTAGTWIAGYLKKTLNWHNLRFRQSGMKKEWIISLLRKFEAGRITDRNAEMVIRKMVEEKKPPRVLIKKYGFGKAKLDLDKIVKTVLNNNRRAAEDYKKGEKKALHFLVGQVMRETRGRADARDIKKAILRQI